MKKKIIFAPLVLFLCSFAPRMGTYNTVGLTLCSYSTYTSSGIVSSGIGHSYVVLENNRSRPLDLGFYQVRPFEKITLGLLGNDGFTENNSSGSMNAEVDGIFYNREAYVFNHYYEWPTDMVSLYAEVDIGVFGERIANYDGDLNYLQAKAEDYALIGYNCSNFAAEFFSIATATYLGVIASPEVLKTAIRLAGGSDDNSRVFAADSYWRYDADGEMYVYP